MKKILILTMAMYLSTFAVNAGEGLNQKDFPPPSHRMTEAERVKRETAFEQRLGLTDEQKQQAKELRIQGHEKIKPVIDLLKAREQEAQTVKNSKLTPLAQEEKLNNLYSDIKTLRKEAHDIRVKNMKEFEEILTSEQKKTLKEMKQEGKREYKKARFNPQPEKR